MCRCVCIIILWVCVSFDVCIYSSCPFLVYFVFMLILIRYNATSFWGGGGGGGGGGYGTI